MPALLAQGIAIGPILVAERRENPGSSLAFVAGFYLTMIAMLAAWILFFGQAAWISPGVQRLVWLVSAVGMAGFGVYRLVSGLGGLG